MLWCPGRIPFATETGTLTTGTDDGTVVPDLKGLLDGGTLDRMEELIYQSVRVI